MQLQLKRQRFWPKEKNKRQRVFKFQENKLLVNMQRLLRNLAK